MSRQESGAAARRRQRAEEGEELLGTYDSMLCVDAVGAPTSRRKQYCPNCGLPRDPELALKTPCGACSTPESPVYGTQKKPPLFDSDGERIPDDVVAARDAERVRLMQAGRAAARAAKQVQTAPQPTPQQVLVEDYPTSDHALTREREAAKAVKLVQRVVTKARQAKAVKVEQPEPVAQPAGVDIADLFLAAM